MNNIYALVNFCCKKDKKTAKLRNFTVDLQVILFFAFQYGGLTLHREVEFCGAAHFFQPFKAVDSVLGGQIQVIVIERQGVEHTRLVKQGLVGVISGYAACIVGNYSVAEVDVFAADKLFRTETGS